MPAPSSSGVGQVLQERGVQQLPDIGVTGLGVAFEVRQNPSPRRFGSRLRVGDVGVDQPRGQLAEEHVRKQLAERIHVLPAQRAELGVGVDQELG